MWRRFTRNMKSKKGVWRKRISILALSSLLGQVGYNKGEWRAGWRFQRLGRAESRNLAFLRTSTRKIRDHL
jgi:hypothetical protein